MLLADEPVAALDPLHQLRAMALLRAAARKGAGVVAVLHDLTLATRFCDRLIVLAEGRVVADGPPSALTDAVLAEAYGVTALRGEHDGEPFVVPWRAAGPEPSQLTALAKRIANCHGKAMSRQFVIADDHALFRAGLRLLLTDACGPAEVREAGSLPELKSLLEADPRSTSRSSIWRCRA